MSSEFWVGVAVLPVGFLAVALAWFIIVQFIAPTWGYVHYRLMGRIPSRRPFFIVNEFEIERDLKLHEVGRRKLIEVLERIPKMYSFYGFGHVVLIARDVRPAVREDDDE